MGQVISFLTSGDIQAVDMAIKDGRIGDVSQKDWVVKRWCMQDLLDCISRLLRFHVVDEK